ncbi:FAD-dependent monooxygenase [Streptomyces klenkii]|uniref:FAD-dependent oxidoreductase n=1 Tax=Streptomyces klenkii TaxID=1420899 RepID=UPI0033BD360D
MVTVRRGSGQVVIAGCGIAGMLAAAAVAPSAHRIILVERDRLPDEPVPRKGVPQGRHVHALLSTGARAIEELLPGTLAALERAGAQHIALPGDVLLYGPHGWMPRYPPRQYIIGCTRPLLEQVIRHQLLHTHPSIRILQQAEVTGLRGDTHRITGVRLRHRGNALQQSLPADLTIVATGRSGRTAHWLAELGLEPVPQTVVDSGLAYATRLVEAPPEKARAFPFVNIQAQPGTGRPGRAGFLLLLEQNQWIVTLSGTRGAEPPIDEEGFLRFAASLRHPLLSDLLQDTTPLTRITGFRNTANVRHRYDQLPRWPDRLLLTGDTVTCLNPIYAHGMSVAALSALALRDGLTTIRAHPHSDRRIQQTISRASRLPWRISTTSDIRYPNAQGPRPAPGMRLTYRLMDRFLASAATSPAVATAFVDAFALATPPIRLARPSVIYATLRGPRHPPLTTPPPPARAQGTT